LDHVLDFVRIKKSRRGYHPSPSAVIPFLIINVNSRVISSLKACQHPEGGFSGGHGQIAHLAPTYAAVLALSLIGGEDAFDLIDRTKLYTWMMSLKQSDGGFLMHHGGEEDARYFSPSRVKVEIGLLIAQCPWLRY